MLLLRPSENASARRIAHGLQCAVLLVACVLPLRASTQALSSPGGTAPALRPFECPELERLVAVVLAENRGLRAAGERLEQSRIAARQSGAAAWPAADLAARGTRTGQRETGTTGRWKPVNSAEGGLAVSLEIDFWGRVASQRRAAGREREASEADYRAIRMLLAAETAEAWLEWRTAQAELALLAEQRSVNERMLALVESRLARGAGSALDVHRQRSLVQNTLAEAVTVELRLERAVRRIEVLAAGKIGAAPAGTSTLLELPEAPESAGVPTADELAQYRPDLCAAMERIRAADENVAVAIAERLPRLTLSLDGMLSSERLRQPNCLTTVAGGLGLDLPVFDAGRRRLEVERRRSVARERGWTYAELLLEADAEVRNLVGDTSGLRRRCAALLESRRAAAAAVREAQQRHLAGQDSFLAVLDALRTEQGIGREQLQAGLDWRLAWVRLCKARGYGLEAKR